MNITIRLEHKVVRSKIILEFNDNLVGYLITEFYSKRKEKN